MNNKQNKKQNKKEVLKTLKQRLLDLENDIKLLDLCEKHEDICIGNINEIWDFIPEK